MTDDEPTQRIGAEPTTALPVGQPPVSGSGTPQIAYPGSSGAGWGPPSSVPSPGAAASRGRLGAGALIAAVLAAGLVGGGVGALAVQALDDSPARVAHAGSGRLRIDSAPLGSANTSVVAVAAHVLPSVVQIKVSGATEQGTGSGFVLDHAGDIVTNNHVVEVGVGDGTITVVLPSGRERKARVVGRSPSYDLAVIKVSPGGLAPASLGSSADLRVGEPVVAIGSPLGLSSTVTSGIVSALDRPVTTSGQSDTSSFISAIQTDAAINPGNSGGPLVDLQGRVIGVNSAIATLGAAGRGQSGSIGVGFAIPINQVRRTVQQLLADGKAEYPVIGASVATTTDSGARINAVDPGSPAEAAGLQADDVIVSVDGQPVADGVELIVAIREHAPGDTIRLGYTRDGDRARVAVTLDGQVG
ncbi:MAG: S1C family serine protease [Nocardioidaceae bacterium]